MIEVRVRQHHGVELLWIKGKRLPVHQAQVLVALEQAAIDEHLLPLVRDEGL